MWNVLWMVCCYYYNIIIIIIIIIMLMCVPPRFFVLLRERLFFFVGSFASAVHSDTSPLPLTPWRMYVRIAGVGEFTTKQYPIKWYSYNSAIVYISICPVANVFVCFVCVVLY
jgi:hypothetical protein